MSTLHEMVCVFFLMIRAPPRSTRTGHTRSLHDALPIWPRRSRSTATATAVGRAYVHDMLLAPRPRCPGSTTAIGTSRYAIPTISAMPRDRSEEHTSELQSLMRISYAVFCLKKKKQYKQHLIKYQNIHTHK